MKTTSFLDAAVLLAVVGLLIPPRSSIAGSWNIHEDYSCMSNPNGVWSYGRTWAAGNGGFDLMPCTWSDNNPNCVCSSGTECGWYMCNWGHGGPGLAPGVVLWAKDNSNGYPVVRWTSPDAGSYRVSGEFTWADDRGVDNFVYVVVNDSIRISGRILAPQDTVRFCLDHVDLGAGDQVEFLVVWAGGVYSEYGWTRVTATVATSEDPCSGAGWPPDGLPLCGAAGDQWMFDAVPDGQGGALALWLEPWPGPLRVQRATAAGAVAPGWPSCGVIVNTAHPAYNQDLVSMVPDGSGGAFVAWGSYVSQFQRRIYAQHVASDGVIASGWPTDGVLVSTGTATQILPQMALDGTGGLFVAFRADKVRLQRIALEGTIAPGWPAAGIAMTAGTSWGPAVVSDDAGGAIVFFTASSGGAEYDLYAQRVTGSGAFAWPTGGVPVCQAPGPPGDGSQPGTVAVGDGEGGAIVAFYDTRNLSTSGRDIYAQRVTASGAIHSSWPAEGVPLCTAPGNQPSSSGFPALRVASDGQGGMFAAWPAYDDAGDSDMYATRVDGDGLVPGCWPVNGLVVCSVARTQGWHDLASDGEGGAVLAWTDERRGVGQSDVYLQHLTPSGQTTLGAADGGALLPGPSDSAHPHIAFDPSANPNAIIAFSGSGLGWDPYAQCVEIGSLPTPTSATVGYWRFETADGDSVSDVSGYDHTAHLLNGAAIGSVVPATGVGTPGGACVANMGSLSLASGLLDAVAINDAPGLRPCAALTLECWIRPEPGAHVIIGKQLDSPGCCANSYSLEISHGQTGGLNFILSSPDGTQNQLLSQVSPSTTQWSHVAGAWDGEMMRLYLNYAQIDSLPFAGPIGYDGNPVLIGADDDGQGVPGCCFFDGEIDEVRVSQVALEPSQFLAPCPPTAVAEFGSTGPGMRVQPSVTRAGTKVVFARPLVVSAQLRVFDVQGRVVRRISLPAGVTEAVWDGFDSQVGRVASGVYFLRLEAGGAPEMTRVVVVR